MKKRYKVTNITQYHDTNITETTFKCIDYLGGNEFTISEKTGDFSLVKLGDILEIEVRKIVPDGKDTLQTKQ
jgi:hypothetical protein